MKQGGVVQNKGIAVVTYCAPECSGLSKLSFQSVEQIRQQSQCTMPPDVQLDLLWHVSKFTSNVALETRPGWSGYMTDVSKGGDYPGQSIVHMLPIIDLDPTDMSCIYSTLLFVIIQAGELNIPTPILTFDQPLWLKAMEIVTALDLKIVLILGGFHTLMSYVGSIGKVMSESGLSTALEIVYGKVAVTHILTGKAIARALRGFFMLESVLTSRLLSQFFPEVVSKEFAENENDITSDMDDGSSSDETESDYDINEDNDDGVTSEDPVRNENNVKQLSDIEVKNIESLCDVIQKDYQRGLDEISNCIELKTLEQELDKQKEELARSSRTAKLWLQCLSYVGILKQYIRAERTGNWSLLLQSLGKMINLFAATGHIHYAKSGRLFLQEMLRVKTDYPWVYKSFTDHGLHTVRRSDRFWAGLWTDLIIEQVMMRSLKSRGGLTRGRGVTESVRTTWINSMHRCAAIHNSMSTLTNVIHRTSEQHVDLTASRRQRDMADMEKLDAWFQTHDPFDPDIPTLRSLSTGLTAGESDNINCDDAEVVGQMIQKKLDGVCFEVATIRRSDQVRILECLQVGVKVDKTVIHIDPLILFTRASLLLERQDQEEQINNFKFEFTPEPSALFKDGSMRKTRKSE